MLLNLKSVPDYKFVIGNLLLLLLLLLDMVLEIWVCVDQGKGFVKGLLSAVGLGAVFAVSYFMAGVAGLFYFFILIVVILVKSLLESIPEVAGIAAGAAIPSAEELNRKVVNKACKLCRHYHYASGTCDLHREERDPDDQVAYHCVDYFT